LSYNSTNYTSENKNIVILDQEKGLEKEELIEKESTLLIKENISKDKKEQDNILEKENISNKSLIKLKHYGNTIPLYFNKYGEPLIVIGPHCKINLNLFRRAFFYMPNCSVFRSLWSIHHVFMESNKLDI
jgi:hypothetical protein